MIDYTDFGRIINTKVFTEEFGEDHKIVITFSLSGQVYPEKLANASYTLNRIRSYPDNYVVCDIGEILRARQMETADREEIIKLRNRVEKLGARWDAMYTSLKEKGVEVLYLGDVDRHPVIDIKFADERLLNKKDKEEIEKLNEALKDSDHLCRVRSDIINDKNKRIKELEERIKELESDRTVRVTINPNGSLTFSRDGKSETVLMPVEEDPTKCVHYRGSGICYGCSMNTPSFRCADNQHPCKEYKKKKE